MILAAMNMGCVTHLEAYPPQEHLQEPVGFGSIHLWQERPSGRIFLPELASFEFTTKDGEKRYRLDIEAASSYFFLALKPGLYQVTRVFIQEGGFRSSAEIPLTFVIPEEGVAYLGEWSFQIDSPNFTRELEVTIAFESVKALVELNMRYPSLAQNSLISSLAEPAFRRSRLFEITPYPRFRWFHRHNPT